MILATPQQGLEHLEAHGVVVDGEDPHADGELVPLPPRDRPLLLHPRSSAQKHPDSPVKSEQQQNPTRKLPQSRKSLKSLCPQSIGSKAWLGKIGANAWQEQGRWGTRPAAPDSEARLPTEEKANKLSRDDAGRGEEADDAESRKAKAGKKPAAAAASGKTTPETGKEKKRRGVICRRGGTAADDGTEVRNEPTAPP